MNFCPHCGAQLRENSPTCPTCYRTTAEPARGKHDGKKSLSELIADKPIQFLVSVFLVLAGLIVILAVSVHFSQKATYRALYKDLLEEVTRDLPKPPGSTR